MRKPIDEMTFGLEEPKVEVGRAAEGNTQEVPAEAIEGKAQGRVGRIMQAIKKMVLGGGQHGVELVTRRDVLKGLGAAGIAAAGASILGKIGAAQAEQPEAKSEDNLKKFAEEVDNRMREIENNPDSIEKYFNDGDGLYWLLTLNFIDLIMGLANKNVATSLGKKAAKLAKRNSLAEKLEAKEEHNFAKLASGALGKIIAGKDDKYPEMIQRAIGEHSEEGGFNRNFPHPNLYFAAVLNVAMAMGAFGEAKKEEAIHQIEETGIGVGLLLGLGAAADGTKYSEGSVYRKFTTEEKQLVDKLVQENGETMERMARPEKNLIAPTLKKDIDLLAEVIGPAPFMAACTQFPLLAFGNADMTKIRLEGALPICKRVFRVFEGYNAEEVKAMCDEGVVKNEVLKKLILRHCRVSRDKSAHFSIKEMEKLGEDYFAEIGLGLMSSTMDVTQGFGDVAPAVVGSYQSFGGEEMLKTAVMNFTLSFSNGIRETQLVAKRLGVETNVLLNKEHLGRIVRFWWASVKNLLPFRKADERGAKFEILDGIGESLIKMTRTAIGGSANVVFGALGGEVDPSLNNAALDDLETVVAEIKKEEEVEVESEEGDETNVLSRDATEKFEQLASAIRERADVALVEEKVEALAHSLEKGENQSPEKYRVIKKLREAAHMLEHNPQMMDLLSFEYWEKHAGQTSAETTFVVTAQGLSLKGIEKILNKWVYGPMLGAMDLIPFEGSIEMSLGDGKSAQRSVKEVLSIGSSGVIHTGVSMVADNWADEILHANQLTSEIFLKPICKEFGVNMKEIKLNEKLNVTKRWKELHQQIDAKLVARGAGRAERMKLAARIYDKFTITKYVAIWFAIFGGGEDTIGNSPHFRAFVDEIKTLITLNKSWADIVKHFSHHYDRYIRTLAMSYLVGPMVEMAIYENPFIGEELKAA